LRQVTNWIGVVTITRIVGGLAGGMTIEEIMREYEVTEEDIWAALNYATDKEL